MASEGLVSDSVDPLSELNGPMLFPRTIRASTDVLVPVDVKSLDSIHNFLKSLELRNSDKLMNEAKRIVDGGAEFLESNLANIAKTVHVTDVIATKGKDRPQERRPGLGLARKRATFSLKTSVSRPSVSLEPSLNIDHLEDPDEFFDAYERTENAKKEIQKQLGGSMDNLKPFKPSNNARSRRQGILGKSYNYKHCYASEPSENDMVIMSQEKVDQGIPRAHKDKSQEELVVPDPVPDTDLEENECPVSMKTTENKVNDILEELLSCNNEDLEGDGALNLLQERLKIRPLDLENLCMNELPDVGWTSIFTATEPNVGNTSIPTVTGSLQKSSKSSQVIGSALKNLSQKLTELKPVANPVNSASSPTPPRSPFASISLLKRRILQPNPKVDPFSPINVDLSACQNVSHAQPKDKLLEQVDAPKDLGMSSEFESHVEVGNAEPIFSNMDAQEGIQNTESLPKQFVDENASAQSREDYSRPNAESDNIDTEINIDDDKSNPSVLEDEARVDKSSRKQTDPEQQLEIHQAKQLRGQRAAGEKRIRKAHPMRKSLAESGTSFETGVRRSKRVKMRPLEYWKGERFLYGRVDNSLKLIGVKYISPSKGSNDMKVKPFILSDSSKYEEILEMAARH